MADSLDAGATSLPKFARAEKPDSSSVDASSPTTPATGSASSAKPASAPTKSTLAQLGKPSVRVRTAVPAIIAASLPERLPPRNWKERMERLREDAPGFLVSLGIHGAVLLILSLVAIPQEVRENLINTLIATNEPLQDIGEGLDDSTLSQDQLKDLEAQAVMDVKTPIIADKPAQFDLDISDGMPQMEITDPLQDVVGAFIAKGDLAGRSQQGRTALLAAQGGTAGSEAAVNRGLKWLARHQRPDGSWSFQHGDDDPGSIDNPTGATGLALLAFLGGGHTHVEGDYRKQVALGIKYLLSKMKTTPTGGDLRSDGDPQGMYAQGICTIALCEAYALSKDKDLKLPTQQAINFIVNAQDPKGGGWRYYPGQKGDTSVVGWQVMALKSAKIAKLQIPQKAISKSTAFLNSVQTERGAKYGYEEPGNGIGTTAVGLLCRMYLGWTPKNVALGIGVEFLSATGPQPHNIYFDYYATQVMHHWGGEPWKKWNTVMREYLISTQEKEGDAAGSWKPVSNEHDEATGGRLYRTCMSIMTLEVYYRHLPLYQRETMKVEF